MFVEGQGEKDIFRSLVGICIGTIFLEEKLFVFQSPFCFNSMPRCREKGRACLFFLFKSSVVQRSLRLHLHCVLLFQEVKYNLNWDNQE